MNKKDFSDWLVVSDIDGTLNNKLRKTPEKNIAAIDRFVHELSGNFTLASARGVQSLRPHYKKLPNLKTPAIVLNGAGIYDFSKEKTINNEVNPIEEKTYNVTEQQIKETLNSFLGTSIQTTPIYSAVKVNGKNIIIKRKYAYSTNQIQGF